jgi:hypothetical protein
MAKLSSRGRTEVFRAEREQIPAPSDDPGAAVWRKSTIVLMNDGTTLEKDQVKFAPGPHDAGKPRLHDWGWKKRGKLTAGKDPKQLLELYAKRGYLVAAAPGISGFDASYYRALAAAKTGSAPESLPTPKPPRRQGTWAWTENGQVFIPEVKITSTEPGMILHGLRGHGYQLAVEKHGEIVGWMPIETAGFNSVKDWIAAQGGATSQRI